MQVFDKDILASDDFMGETYLLLKNFLPNTNQLVNLEIQDGGDSYLMKKCRKGRSIGTMEIRFNYTYQLNQSVKSF